MSRKGLISGNTADISDVKMTFSFIAIQRLLLEALKKSRKAL